MKNWELDDISKLMSRVTGEEYFELGEDLGDDGSGLADLD